MPLEELFQLNEGNSVEWLGKKNLINGTWSSDTETNRCNFMQLAQEILLFLVVPTGGGSK